MQQLQAHKTRRCRMLVEEADTNGLPKDMLAKVGSLYEDGLDALALAHSKGERFLPMCLTPRSVAWPGSCARQLAAKGTAETLLAFALASWIPCWAAVLLICSLACLFARLLACWAGLHTGCWLVGWAASLPDDFGACWLPCFSTERRIVLLNSTCA